MENGSFNGTRGERSEGKRCSGSSNFLFEALRFNYDAWRDAALTIEVQAAGAGRT